MTTLTRRQTFHVLGTSLASFTLLRCDPSSKTGPDATILPDSEPFPDGGQCSDTPNNIEGPFFTPNSPERQDIRPPGSPGVELHLSGRVFNSQCQPLVGAVLDFWQADNAGDYETNSDKFRGHQFTDSQGRYSLRTIIPGRYLNGNQFRPAHIHVKVTSGNGPVLTTQLYFPEDPYNGVDPWYLPELEIASANINDPANVIGTFDFVLV